MTNIILYYCIVPFMLINGVYLISRSLIKIKSKSKSLARSESINFDTWHFVSLFIGLGIFSIGLLIALGIINPPI